MNRPVTYSQQQTNVAISFKLGTDEETDEVIEQVKQLIKPFNARQFTFYVDHGNVTTISFNFPMSLSDKLTELINVIERTITSYNPRTYSMNTSSHFMRSGETQALLR